MKVLASCNRETISLYLEDALSPAGETALEQHLNTCADCREHMASAAGSGDQWHDITTALRPDEWDNQHSSTRKSPAWPLTLLGPTDDPCMLGRIGPFEVSGCIGVGGMGVVFKARDPALDRFVAVKVLSPQLAASESARIRFAREAKAAAAVVHDNVIAVHQVAEYQGLPYLVMPYVPGPSLEERIRRKGPMPVVDAIRVARQVASGLVAAHAQGLIHRDIKPANILLSGNTERAVITDFGLARAADDATLTRSGSLAGTPQFMAPEQARGEPADSQSDLFSLGAMLFAMLTGSPAVANLSGAETVRQVSSVAPVPLHMVCGNVPKWLQQLMAGLHCFDPTKRIASAAFAEQMLAAAVTKASSTTLPLQHNKSAYHWTSTQKLSGMGAAVILTAVMWIATAVWWDTGNESSTKTTKAATQQQKPTTTHTSAVPPTDKNPRVKTLEVQKVPEPQTLPVDQTDAKPSTFNLPKDLQQDLDGKQLDLLLHSIDQQLNQLQNR